MSFKDLLPTDNMTSEDIHHRYYDRPCRVCKEIIHGDDEFADCNRCGKLMCEDCHVKAQFSCHVCAEKLEKGLDYEFRDVCRGCLTRCKLYGLSFHATCKCEHRTACSPLGRAQREFALATKRVQHAKGELVRAKQELQDAKTARSIAEKRLIQLQRATY